MVDARAVRTTGRRSIGWLIGVFVSIALTVALSFFSNLSFQKLSDASQQLERTNQILLQIERLTSQLRDAELQQRGYLVTGDERFLEAYGRASSAVAQSMSRARQLTSDDADQQGRLRRLEPLIAARLGLLEQMIELRHTHDVRSVDAEQLSRAGALLAQIDSIAAEMTEAESRLYQLRNATAEHQAQVMTEILIFGTFISLGIVGTISFLMSREVGRRRRAEEVLQGLNNALEQRVAARTTELRREVAERRRTEEILESTSTFLDTVVENFPGMVFVKDAKDGRFVLFNRAGEELLGYHRSNLIGKRDRDIFPKSEADSFLARDRQVVESGKAVVIPEERITTRERGMRLLRTTEVAVPDEQGRPQYLVGFSEDITERKEIEQQLRQGLKMEAMGQLTGGVAHDFNNLLGIVIGNLDLVLEMSGSSNALREAAQAALNGALRGAELTKLLLAFSRKRQPQPLVVDLNERLAQVVPMLRQTLSRQISVEIHPGAQLWPVLIDPSQADTAILNICINARDAMAKGGRLVIETGNATLDQHYAERNVDVLPGEYVHMSFSDTGTGIEPQVLERVFEPFFTTKGKGKGTGLGLSMVYGFVKQSGGHIKIESEVGRGTTVNIYFPRTYAVEAAEPVVDTAPLGQARGRELVLVVEDEEGMRNVTVRQLADLGYRTIEADTGPAALAVLENHPEVDLLFSDVIMPGGMNGYELAREARRRRPELKILMTSGFTARAQADAQIEEVGEADRLELLDKPFRKRDLAVRIRQTLDQAS
jgi:PAS domain S-box-containing protein